jgi:hypothetical protein
MIATCVALFAATVRALWARTIFAAGSRLVRDARLLRHLSYDALGSIVAFRAIVVTLRPITMVTAGATITLAATFPGLRLPARFAGECLDI